MTTLATGVAVYAALVLLLPGFGPPFILERRTMMPLAIVAHLTPIRSVPFLTQYHFWIAVLGYAILLWRTVF